MSLSLDMVSSIPAISKPTQNLVAYLYNGDSMKKLSKKQSQWAWFVGLYFAGFLTIFIIAQLIRMAMGIE